MSDLNAETEANTEYIRRQGYTVVEMRECEWGCIKSRDPLVRIFIASKFQRPLDHAYHLNEQPIHQAVVNEQIFGVVEFDIRVPEHLKEHFSEMCPIFKNVYISREDIGEFMKTFAEENDIMT